MWTFSYKSIYLSGMPFFFHFVSVYTCVCKYMYLWKNCHLEDKLNYIFCWLPLNFWLLCSDFQLGKTLIDSCEISSVIYLKYHLPTSSWKCGGFKNFRERALLRREVNEELMLEVNLFCTLAFNFCSLSLNPSYTTLMFVSCTGQNTLKTTAWVLRSTC